ncbi:MAG: hypothetical protein WA188_05360 [Terriglobales bacterium]
MREECYMCDAVATSAEHVPPQCFFPEGYRCNLITVPSCAAHNQGNSEDVEYVRNVISTQHGTNDAAARLFEKTKRSFNRSPKLLTQTFGGLRPVLVEGEETGAFRIDLARHRRVMKAIAYAIYFHDNARKHRGGWRIFTPSFGYAENIYSGQPDPWEDLRRLLDSGQYTAMPVPQPEVFKYGQIRTDQNQLIYKFEFYERIVVNAWTLFQAFVAW